MHVRLYDESGTTLVTGSGRPACKGPATCIGYLDAEANAQLFTDDGWMLMGDICSIDESGLLRVTGRTSDIIIRGGKNISAPQVEDEVSSHPAIALAAAVAKPDEVFGERVFVFVELVPGAAPITLEQLKEFLLERGVSVELVPEGMEIVDELPRSSGGKLAKGTLRNCCKIRAPFS
jgi:acyl-CoA synthetase